MTMDLKASSDDPRHFHWHGFTQMADYQPLVIERAQGCLLTTTDGRELLDGVSSLWCNVHGHRHPSIDAAIRGQLDRVAHVTSLGMSCDTTERLAARLAEITPGDLQHVFFSSDGSSAVEAALKMAIQYWHQCSDPPAEKTPPAEKKPPAEKTRRAEKTSPAEKTQYVALGAAYHGDTTGAVALGGIDFFHSLFAPILFKPLRGPTPCSFRLPQGRTIETAADDYAGQIESILRQQHETIAAVVMEPLVQGAAGMITHPSGLLQRIRRLCDQYNVLLICDEVATGFGRTGKMFACEHESVTPDILCVGKGLTGGYLPMAATIARPHVYEAFLAPAAAMKQFFHGHTFGGNPLAAAAALASIDLIQQNDVVSSVADKSARLRTRLAVLDDHPHVGDIRGRGLMVGIELVRDRETKQGFEPEQLMGARVCRRCVDEGVWVRPLGDVIVLMPPLCVSDQQLDQLADVVIDAIKSETHALSDLAAVSNASVV